MWRRERGSHHRLNRHAVSVILCLESTVCTMNILQKRKIVDSIEDVRKRPLKQPRLDAFFSPVRAAESTALADPGLPQTTGKGVVVSAFKSKPNSIPKFSDEQKAVLRMVVEEGRSVFFTGSAGSSGSRTIPRDSGSCEGSARR